MEQPEPVHVEVEPATEPIEGTVTQPGRPPRRFSGWMELVGLLECARGSARTDDANPAS
jgi:hypothetical protein